MQDLTKSLILLNGELKTLQIASISKLDANAFRVSFKNSPKSYTYSADKVVWLTNPQWLVPELCKVFRNGRLQTDVTEIWQFEAGQNNYWRIKYRSGYEGEYTDGQINVVKTCLDEETSKMCRRSWRNTVSHSSWHRLAARRTRNSSSANRHWFLRRSHHGLVPCRME